MTDQATFAHTLVDEWRRAGVTDAVVAPGSRSTPLALAVHESGMRVHVCLDERSAGFLALGIGCASGRPAVVVTTSGSAPAHVLPAVMEAAYARIPMIVCSADRPAELHDVGAPQTATQTGLFRDFVRWTLAASDLPVSSWRSVAARAVLEATRWPPAPVHLNLAFREPLVGAPGPLPSGRPLGEPWHAHASRHSVSLPPLLGDRGVIVATSGIADPGGVIELGQALGWPILAGPRSGCRGLGPGVVCAFDAVLRHTPAAEALVPDVVVRLGGDPASKVTTAWLSSTPGITSGPGWHDASRSATVVVDAPPDEVSAALLRSCARRAAPGWVQAWDHAEARAQEAIDAVIDPLSEPGIARALTAALPAEATMVVASSMPIRDVEWFGHPRMACDVISNRGLNGIDGVVSTALGVALARQAPVVALTGDLAFLHDSGGLTGVVRRGVDCTFVVLDNDGGGIFSFLPPATSLDAATFETLWGTPHGTDLALLASAHGIPVVPFGVTVGEGVRVMVVRTSRPDNVRIHDDLVSRVAEALERAPTVVR